MEYFLAYLIEGAVAKYHQKLVKEVGPRFGENHMTDNPQPSHITLKSPFKLNSVKKLDKILKRFAENQISQRVVIGGFGNFRRFVAFLKIKLPKRAREIQKSLLLEVDGIDGIKIHNFDKKFKPHATISYGNTRENFNQIWEYLRKKKERKFYPWFDNITLLKKTNGLWKVYKIYRFGDKKNLHKI